MSRLLGWKRHIPEYLSQYHGWWYSADGMATQGAIVLNLWEERPFAFAVK